MCAVVTDKFQSKIIVIVFGEKASSELIMIIIITIHVAHEYKFQTNCCLSKLGKNH